jgi:hypothetical protein
VTISIEPKNHPRFGRMISLVTPSSKLKILKKCPGDFTENIPEFQEDQYEDSSKEFLSCYEDIFPSPPGPTRVVQDTIKGEGIQRKKQLHRSPLNLQGEVHPLPDISMDKFPMFFGNTSEDAEKHLIKFDSACEIFNVAENDVACPIIYLNSKGKC